ncbi:MAG: hypothetical protein CXT75_10855 [Methanobacteriota archaeon]|jgi:hypothetical protein|uniref:Uncharacterized protein n=1 Tax=Marine Group III euryarchaeote TaxID=2173149 RepID=A0A7J4GSJ1_9ARCH|nr:MAG: hypothetical protein CXT75_10855 [Euryarchaeota archaeon]HIF37586.1 hypothetical protein [Marine Group III euryarchaeote]
MSKVSFEIFSTERGKKLIDLGELLVEAGYLKSFVLDEEESEIIFNFNIKVGFDVEKAEIDMEALRVYYDAADDVGKKFTDEILRSVFDLDDTGHIWKH